MVKSALIDAVREDYLKSHPDACVEKVAKFCQYMTDWLAARGIVGIGHIDQGLALRMSDGSEIGLVSYENQPTSAQTAPVNITVIKATPRAGILGDSPAHQITGQ